METRKNKAKKTILLSAFTISLLFLSIHKNSAYGSLTTTMNSNVPTGYEKFYKSYNLRAYSVFVEDKISFMKVIDCTKDKMKYKFSATTQGVFEGNIFIKVKYTNLAGKVVVEEGSFGIPICPKANTSVYVKLLTDFTATAVRLDIYKVIE